MISTRILAKAQISVLLLVSVNEQAGFKGVFPGRQAPKTGFFVTWLNYFSFLQEKFDGSVEFQSVSFQYPSRPDVTVLHDISFSASPGETVALVGSSGCGKSTTVSLLERFYDPINGAVVSCINACMVLMIII